MGGQRGRRPIRLDNVGIAVRDLEAAIAFFTDLGLTVLGRARVSSGAAGGDRRRAYDDAADIAVLQTPDGHGRIEMFQYVHPEAIEAEPVQPNTIGMHRVAFAVDDIDAALAIAARHGLPPAPRRRHLRRRLPAHLPPRPERHPRDVRRGAARAGMTACPPPSCTLVTGTLPMAVDPFAALADPVRRGLLRALAAGPARVVDLAAAHPISRPAVSKHLRLLTEAGLATVEDRGRERHYALDRSGLAPVSGLLDELRPGAAGPRPGLRRARPRGPPHGPRTQLDRPPRPPAGGHRMSTTTPLGRRETRDGAEHLVLTRTFAAPLEDVWAACTEPARMQRWIGTWTGDPASGEIAFRMTAEGEDVPEEVYLVEVCEPPRRFVVRSRDAAPFSEDGSGPRVTWQHTLELDEADGVDDAGLHAGRPRRTGRRRRGRERRAGLGLLPRPPRRGVRRHRSRRGRLRALPRALRPLPRPVRLSPVVLGWGPAATGGGRRADAGRAGTGAAPVRDKPPASRPRAADDAGRVADYAASRPPRAAG